MKNLDAAIEDLKDIINSKMVEYSLPYEKGNSIRIGDIVIRKSKNLGYIVLDVKNNKSITNAFSKSGAIAIAKAYIKKQSYHTLKLYDNIIEKHYNDSCFYYNILQTTEDLEKQEIMEIRLEDAQDKMESARYVLDEFIMSEFR